MKPAKKQAVRAKAVSKTAFPIPVGRGIAYAHRGIFWYGTVVHVDAELNSVVVKIVAGDDLTVFKGNGRRYASRIGRSTVFLRNTPEHVLIPDRDASQPRRPKNSAWWRA